MISKVIKIGIVALFVFFIAVLARWYFVEQDIRNRPIEITKIANSGYTPRGVFGNGNVVVDGGELGWYVYDVPTEDGYVKKVCENKRLPTVAMDFDFFTIKVNGSN